MELKHLHARSWLPRLVGFSCVVGLAVTTMGGAAPPVAGGLYLLAAFAAGWPWLARLLLLGFGQHWICALALHVVECLVMGGLLLQLPAFAAASVATALLAGPAALGGLLFLLPSAAALAVGLLACAPLLVPSVSQLLSLALLLGFVLFLSLEGFRHTQRHYERRTVAESESTRLRQANARLARYFPAGLLKELRRAPAARQPPRQTWVTAVFIDVVGFTRLVSNGSTAQLVDVLNDYQAALTELVTKHEGELGKYLGDGALVYYLESADRAADAQASVRLCRALPGMLALLGECWHARGLMVELQCRAGVASGYCVVGDWGGQRLDHTVIGDAINLASRLQQAAPAGGILLAEATAALLLSRDPQCGWLGPSRTLALKGFGDVTARALVDVSSAAQ